MNIFVIDKPVVLSLILVALFYSQVDCSLAQEPEKLLPLSQPIELLDGQSLKGWTYYSNDESTELEDVWSVADGVLKCAGKPAGYLQTKRWYRDYELNLEWRWPGERGGNSGVLVHATTPLVFYGWPKSMEIQLQSGRAGDFWVICEGVDVRVADEEQRRAKQKAGNQHTHRRIQRLEGDFENEVGEWNSMKVVCRADQIKVWVNDQLVNHGTEMTISEGAIALQSEGTAIEYRDINLRPLNEVVGETTGDSTSELTSAVSSNQETSTDEDSKNTVIVMGMIHSGHREPGPFDIENLQELIREIKPDYVLTEIPPDRLAEAAQQFRDTGAISESRVRVFPEYTDALFPLTREMDFEIIPCAAWTREMADSRRDTLQRLQTSHQQEYAEMDAAQRLAGENIARLGDKNDPVIVHTHQYDQFVKLGMGPYDRHFNDLIGDGGWENINAAHYALIAQALDKHSGEGKRFLITFGAWHKYYIKEQLEKRNDINVMPMSEFLQDEQNSPEEWPRFRLNSGGNNSYGITEIQNPEVAWKYDTGEVIESSAVVAGDTLYVGGHAQKLHAIDRKTGDLKWEFEVGGWVRATPAVVGGVVYFGADDNKFYALEAATGDLKWEFELGEGGEQSTPTVLNGVVYFGAFDNFVYALEAESGDLIWKFDAGASMLSSPLVTEDSLYIGTYAGAMFRLDRKTGDQVWKFQENETSIFSSAVANREIVIFTSYDQHVYAVNISDGSIAWQYKTDGQIFSSPTMVGETTYVGSNDSHLYALNTASGEVVWKTDLGGAVFSSPAVTDNSIYVGSSDGHLYAVDRQGAIRWKHLVGEGVRVWTSPAVVQGKIYFGSHGGEVIVLQEKTDDE